MTVIIQGLWIHVGDYTKLPTQLACACSIITEGTTTLKSRYGPVDELRHADFIRFEWPKDKQKIANYLNKRNPPIVWGMEGMWLKKNSQTLGGVRL